MTGFLCRILPIKKQAFFGGAINDAGLGASAHLDGVLGLLSQIRDLGEGVLLGSVVVSFPILPCCKEMDGC